jgi:hypothetical protein
MQHAMVICTALAVVLAAWLSGCGASPAAVAPPPEATGSPTAGHEGEELESAPARPTGTPAASPESTARTKLPTETPVPDEESATSQSARATPGTRLPSGAGQIVEIAKEDLARRLGLSPGEIAVTSVEAVEWPDASLGCPQPDMTYAQVITPGYLIVLEAAGQTYEYHTNEDSSVVMCQRHGPDLVPLMPVAPHGIPGRPRASGD